MGKNDTSIDKENIEKEIDISKKHYSAFSNVIYILKEAYRNMKVVPFMMVLKGIADAGGIFILLVIPKVVIDCVQNNKGVSMMVIQVLPIGIIALIFLVISKWLENQMFWRFTYIRGKFIIKKVNKAISMDYQRFEQPKLLDCLEKAEKAVEGSWMGIEGILHNLDKFLSSIVAVIIAITSILVINPIVVAAMFVLSFGNFFFLLQAKKVDKRKHWDKMADKWRKLEYMKNSTRDFKYAKDIRVFGMTNWLSSIQRKENYSAHILFKQHYFRWVGYASLMQIFSFLQDIILYGWLIYSVLYKGMTLGDFSLYMGIATAFFINAVALFDAMGNIKQDSLYVDDYRTFVEFPEANNENGIALNAMEEYEFKFEHVYFRYSGQQKDTLKDINITLKAGERIAIVGLNGAGKTTFIKLLCRLYEPTRGRILLNGIDIKNYNKEDYYGIIAPVFQNVECFAFPISENISMSSPVETNIQMAEECADKADLTAQIAKYDKGIQTELLKILYDDGVDLSGGQKQKLALARALYKDAPVVVLDEPTAALDALAEYKMYKDFDKLIGGKTAVYISHRLSSTQFCNIIAMFKDGRIVEYGTHKQLLDKNGEYAKLFEVQAQYYKENNKDNDTGSTLNNSRRGEFSYEK